MQSIIGFLIGIALMIPFVIGCYYIGRREGWDDGYRIGRLKGATDAFNECNETLEKAKVLLTDFRDAIQTLN